MLDDLYREETTFNKTVCVNALVETDDGKTTAELIRRSLCLYPETMNINMYETFFSYIEDLPNYCHTSMATRYEKMRGCRSYDRRALPPVKR